MGKEIQDILTYLIKDTFGGTKYTQYTLPQMKATIETYINSELKKRNIKSGNAEYNKLKRFISKTKAASSKEQILTYLSETLLTLGGFTV